MYNLNWIFYYQCNVDNVSTNNELLSPESHKTLLNEMMTLTNVNNQNTSSMYSPAINEDMILNTDTIPAPVTDSKVHSQIPVDMYVFEEFKL